MRGTRTAAPLAAVLLAVAGCGGGGTAAATRGAASPTAAVTTAASATPTTATPRPARPRHRHRTATPATTTPASTGSPTPRRTTASPAPRVTRTHRPSPTASPTPAPCADTAKTVALAMRGDGVSGYRFDPTSISVTCGGSIVITNESPDSPHTMTPAHGGFAKTGNVAPNGGTATVRVRYRGTYSFYCSLHPTMTGTVRVT